MHPALHAERPRAQIGTGCNATRVRWPARLTEPGRNDEHFWQKEAAEPGRDACAACAAFVLLLLRCCSRTCPANGAHHGDMSATRLLVESPASVCRPSNYWAACRAATFALSSGAGPFLRCPGLFAARSWIVARRPGASERPPRAACFRAWHGIACASLYLTSPRRRPLGIAAWRAIVAVSTASDRATRREPSRSGPGE